MNEYGPYIRVGASGHLEIEGCDAIRLVEEFGAPLWVISENTIRANYRRLKQAFQKCYPRTRIAYASKANPQPAILKILKTEGALVDAVTIGHIGLITRAGFAPQEIIFNGNSKTESELVWALKHDISAINVDSLDEMELIAKLQPYGAQTARIAVRLATDPALHADDPEFARAQANSKFGMDEADALAGVEIALNHPGLGLVGLHNHIGFSAYGINYSAELDLQRHTRCVDQVMLFASKIRERYGVSVQHVNLGGGYRVGRSHGFGPKAITSMPSADEYARAIAGRLRESAARLSLADPELVLEAGGYLVADAVALLARVGFLKKRRTAEGDLNWIFLEQTSAYHFVRRLLHQMYHHVVVANRANEEGIAGFNIAGPTCAADTVAWQAKLPVVGRGDVLAILDQGAYCEAVTTDFCAIPIPGAVLVCGEEADLVRQPGRIGELLERFTTPRRLESRAG